LTFIQPWKQSIVVSTRLWKLQTLNFIYVWKQHNNSSHSSIETTNITLASIQRWKLQLLAFIQVWKQHNNSSHSSMEATTIILASIKQWKLQTLVFHNPLSGYVCHLYQGLSSVRKCKTKIQNLKDEGAKDLPDIWPPDVTPCYCPANTTFFVPKKTIITAKFHKQQRCHFNSHPNPKFNTCTQYFVCHNFYSVEFQAKVDS